MTRHQRFAIHLMAWMIRITFSETFGQVVLVTIFASATVAIDLASSHLYLAAVFPAYVTVLGGMYYLVRAQVIRELERGPS
jgi:hypothetical protein